MASLMDTSNLTVSGFFEALIKGGYDNWNTTFKDDYISDHLPGFDKIANGTRDYFFSILSEKLINDLEWLWGSRNETLGTDYNITAEIVNYFIQWETSEGTTERPLSKAEICRLYYHEIISEVVIFMLAPATVMLFLLSFVQRRKNLKLSCLWGRPSFLYPVNFVDEVGRRWAFAACFAMMTQLIIDLFTGNLFWNPGSWNDAEWVLRFSWVKTFNLIGNVIHLGYLFYPLFVCLSLRRMIPANILGLAYLSIWIYFDINWYMECGVVRNKEGYITLRAIIDLLIEIPLFLADLAMAVCFIYDLIVNSINLHMERTGKERKRKSRWGGKETLPLQYIEYLMTHKVDKPETLKEKIKKLCSYTKINGFKYPPRVVCTMVVAFLGLYTMVSAIGFQVDEILDWADEWAQSGQLVDTLLIFYNGSTIYRAPRYVTAIRWSINIGNIVAAFCHVFFMVHMVFTYRGHVLKVMRGDRSWHYKVNMSPAATLVAGMRYSGYQIAYIIWGYIIMFSVVALVLTALSILIFVPLTYGERSWLIDQIIKVLPTVVVSLAIYYIQIVISKFAFLQERGAHLALNNRRIYHAFCYFVFFFNVIVGVFSVLKRTLLSLVFGVILICRLDRCLMMRGFERFDAGYKSYLGMIEVDVHHNHPILKGFIYILRDEVADSKERIEEEKAMNSTDPEKGGVKANRRIDKRIRNKWWKLITLVNNPSLVLERLQEKVLEAKKAKGLKDQVLDAITDAGSVIVAGAAFGNLVNDTPF